MLVSGPFEIIGGFYAGCIVYHLHLIGALEHFTQKATVTEVADLLKYDRQAFQSLVDFVSQTTDILWMTSPEHYILNPAYQPYSKLGFHLDKFVGAYGPILYNLEDSLRSNKLGKTFIDDEIFVYAFNRAGSVGVGLISNLLQEWRVDSLLDLGCGSGILLGELCASNEEFVGWGIDRNAVMCKNAQEQLNNAGFSERVSVVCGDVRVLGRYIRKKERKKIKALYGRSILNEFFRFGSKQAIEFLQMLKRLFPGRLFFICDYYGKLSRNSVNVPRYLHTLLQDLVQVISGQGIPPSDLRDWTTLYQIAGCRLVHTYQGEDEGVDWFIHVVEL